MQIATSQFILTAAADPLNGGSVTESGAFNADTQVIVTPTPSSGWFFTGWAGDCAGDDSCSIIMDSNKSVTANFTQLPTLTVIKTGSGTVTSSPAGINCGASCTGTFEMSDLVILSAIPGDGYLFNGWSGAGCSGTTPCLIRMKSAKNVSASFTGKETLTVIKSGPGTVISTPSGVDCGQFCSAQFEMDTVVTLTATPSANSVFNGWSGDVCSGVGPCLVTMNAAKSVSVEFTGQNYALTVAASPPNAGSLTGAGTYPEGSQVDITPIPNSGWTFTGWSGFCSGTGSCSVNMDGDKSVTARFTLSQFILTTASSPADGGSLTGAGMYFQNFRVTVTASLNPDWYFTGWSGACSGIKSCSVVMSSDKSVTAHFGTGEFTLTTTSSPSQGGFVTGSGTFRSSTQVTVTPFPKSGWSFAGWSGDCSGASLCSVIMDDDKSVIANFNPIQ